MKYSELSTHFIQAMVQAMYREEAAQARITKLLTDAELSDFYYSYMSK